MDKDRIVQKSRRAVVQKLNYGINYSLKKPLIFCSAALLLCSCSSTDIKREIKIPEEVKEVKVDRPAPSELKVPEFVPVTEDISPLKTRIVDIAARNTPLRDVLHVIAEATGLNLVMEKNVSPEVPITLTLKNISAEDALNTIFLSVDYFYTIKDNMLVVKSVDTRIFELGHPAIVQTYNVDVGGDILGGATGAIAGTTTGTTGTTTIKGSVTQSAKSDATAFNFWDAIEKSITSILGTTAAATPGQPAAIQQSFTINRLTGTIMVTASKRNIERVEQYLNVLKRVINRQVLVEAKIIEVQLSEGLKYGIDWTFFDKWKGVGDITVGTRNLSSVVGATLPAFNVGVTGTNFNSVLNALQQQGEVRTLSNPRVNIMNGQTALLSVGRNTAFVSKVETTTTATGTAPTTTYTITTSSVLSGIIIGIVPFINEYGEISLTITPIISDLVQLEDRTVGQAGQNQIQISLPTVDLKELSTTIKVRDGQMVIIGGLISKRETLQDNKVPVLGDVPLLGEAFKSRDKQEKKTELVVVLQPVLVSR
jgi:MSHA type pilus biogenesis protein MshL